MNKTGLLPGELDSIKRASKPHSKRVKRYLKTALLGALGLLAIANAATPHSYNEGSFADNILDALWKKGYHDLSASIFYQQGFGDDLTILDATFLGYYETGRYMGVRLGLGFVFAAPILTFKNDSKDKYEDVKQIYLFDSAYADYLNEHYGIYAIAGRYKSNEEWNTYNSQGFAFTYEGIKNTSLHLTASYGSAFVLNELVTPFRTELSSFGTYLLRAKVGLPYNIEIEPYAYITGFFTAVGIKSEVSYRINAELNMNTKMHIVAYSKYYAAPGTFKVGKTAASHKFEDSVRASYSAGTGKEVSAIAWIEQGLVWRDFLEAKAGLIGVTPAGAELIDYYGQTTPFEYPVGMFWGSAVSPYISVSASLDHIFEAEAGFRGSFSEFGNIFSFEIKGEYNFPIWKHYIRGKIGASVVGVYNSTAYPSPTTTAPSNTIPAANFYGGNNYTLIRSFVRVSI